MGKYVGIDWAGRGWFGAILRDEGEHETEFFPTILNVWRHHRDADRILIDIPIGLARAGRRTCDVRAKELLAPTRHASVFWAPIRPALSAKTLATAKAHTEPHGFSLSNQTWAILPRIREVDEFLDVVPEAVGSLRESHPEVCFAALNAGEPMDHGKKTDAGQAERQALLFAENDALEALYEDAVATFIEPPAYARRLSGDGRADIIDAFVLAETANRSVQRLGTLPSDPPMDSAKSPARPMEIVYPSI